MSHGTVHWTECITGDVEGAKAHYEAVLGWAYETMPMGEGFDYTIIWKDGKMVGGIMPLSGMDDPSARACWMTYLAVDDIGAAVSAATQTGGRVTRAPFNVPTVGTIAMVEEPGGALVGLIQPSAPPSETA